MKLPTLLITTLFLLTACQSEQVIPTNTSAPLPTKTPFPTSTTTPTPSDVFGAIPLNSLQAFSIEPVAKAIFDQTLRGYISAGAIQEFRVDSIAVFPSGDGGLIAEIMYSLHTDNDPWPDDFGAPGADGWITGKCSRFDLVSTETEHQLKNKRLCS
jgi:hypothetical protein